MKMELKNIVAVAGAVTAITAALAIIGLKPPRPAWSTELQELSIQVAGNSAAIINSNLESLARRLYANLEEQERWKAQGKPVPRYLIDERARLEREKREYEDRLRKLSEG